MYKCYLKHFEKLKLLQRQDIPKVFGPTMIPIYPLKMAEIEKVNIFKGKTLAIRLSKSVKIKENYNYLCSVWAFFGTDGPRVKVLEVTV